jgi:kynureninase
VVELQEITTTINSYSPISGMLPSPSKQASDPFAHYRSLFHIPRREDGSELIYLCGNSLGLQPKSTGKYLEQELEDWASLGVEGHFQARHPWMPYHELVAEQTSRLVGALSGEVVVMNSLTVNLHLMLVSFYRPTKQRHRILIEANAFPSDRYAVESQIRFHGFEPSTSLMELPLRPGESVHRTEDILSFIEREGSGISVVLIGGVNYYSGQAFDIEAISRVGHAAGCVVGFDLAHAAGNLVLQLHDWNVDFAVWCSYKYLNAGPGSIAGCFVHERSSSQTDLPRFAGWWGNNKQTRFQMGPEFQVLSGAEGWQISNPPILSLAALRASMDIFDAVGMQVLRKKSEELTTLLERQLADMKEEVDIITPREPQHRGAQLSLRIRRNARNVFSSLRRRGIICDWREPDVIRVAPVPLYNSLDDVKAFALALKDIVIRGND